MKKVQAIANCRVSSEEQLLNGSLGRQNKSVEQKALELNAELVKVWSGAASSKKGVNVERKDLEQMVTECKNNKNIKYVIIDELDRFMRSMLEVGYFIVIFKQLGVDVVFASQPNLTTDTATDTLILMLEAFKAEGSNEERQRKSIVGQTNALMEGRYTFHPKPGYMKGRVAGVHEIDPSRGPALKVILKKIASGYLTPTKALIELNNSSFSSSNSPIKMDKFRRYATDIYYAGFLEIDKQIKVSGIRGMHEPLITIDEHNNILAIFNNKPKYQVGPKRKGNPLYPLNNLLEDELCIDKKDKGRLVGFTHTNGIYNKKYEKYRCRSCGRYWRREDLHEEFKRLFTQISISDDDQKQIIKALEIVWNKDGQNRADEVINIRRSILKLEAEINRKVEDATDPSNAGIKSDILRIIDNKKEQLNKLQIELLKLGKEEEDDKVEFMRFALSFINKTGEHFLEPYVSKENRISCKQLLFPAGLFISQDEKVYTKELSIFYRGHQMKKDAEASDNSLLVRVKRL